MVLPTPPLLLKTEIIFAINIPQCYGVC